MIKASDKAMDTAAKNSEKMIGYGVEEFGTVPGAFYVSSPKGEEYTVNTRAGVENCTCEYFKREGVCKHFCYCQKEVADTARAEFADCAE